MTGYDWGSAFVTSFVSANWSELRHCTVAESLLFDQFYLNYPITVVAVVWCLAIAVTVNTNLQTNSSNNLSIIAYFQSNAEFKYVYTHLWLNTLIFTVVRTSLCQLHIMTNIFHNLSLFGMSGTKVWKHLWNNILQIYYRFVVR